MTNSPFWGIALILSKRNGGMGISLFDVLLLGDIISIPFSVLACVPFTVIIDNSRLISDHFNAHNSPIRSPVYRHIRMPISSVDDNAFSKKDYMRSNIIIKSYKVNRIFGEISKIAFKYMKIFYRFLKS